MTYSSEVRLRDIPKSSRAVRAASAGAAALTAAGILLGVLTGVSSFGPVVAVVAVFAAASLVLGGMNIVTLDRELREVNA